MSDEELRSAAGETKPEFEFRMEHAKRAHDRHHALSTEFFKSVIAFGVEAIRTIALINGGSVVASLALVGNVHGEDPALAGALARAVVVFAIGVLGAGAASSFSYLSQFFYASAMNHVELSWHHPFSEAKPSSRTRDRIGAFFHLIAILCVLTGYLATGLGAWLVASSFGVALPW